MKYWIWKGLKMWACAVQNNLTLWELFNSFFFFNTYKHFNLEVTQLMLYYYTEHAADLKNVITLNIRE